MTTMELRSRIAVLVVAALLSVAGAFGIFAFPAAPEAEAGTILNAPNSCVKTTTYPYFKCF